MSCILHIGNVTSACSVAVSEDGQNVFQKRGPESPFTRRFIGSLCGRAEGYPLPIAMPCRWMQSP